MSDESDFTLSSLKDHAKTKGMWAGALTRVDVADMMGLIVDAGAAAGAPGDQPLTGALGAGAQPLTGVLVPIARPHTPALLKIIDEVIVNATDHWKTHSAGAGRVTSIDVTFDAGGAVSVANDGPGVPTAVHAAASAAAGRPVRVPEVAFAHFLAGTNIVKAAGCVRGGINGLGAKLANVHSESFEVETVDAAGGARAAVRYRQRFARRLDVVGEPEVTPAPGVRPFTRVTFTPAYAALGYVVGVGGAAGGNPPHAAPDGVSSGAAPDGVTPCGADGVTFALAPEDHADLDAWLRLRAHVAAAYVGPKVAVTYNGVTCRTTCAADLAQLVAATHGSTHASADGQADGPADAETAVVLASPARAPGSCHVWDVAFVALPASARPARGAAAAAQNITVVNGVLCGRGAHVRHLRAQLANAVRARLAALTKAKGGAAAPSDAEALARVRLVMCGALPGADWSGQRKDELHVAKAAVEAWALPDAFLKRAAAVVAERLLLAADPGAAAPRRRAPAYEKYTPATHAGRSQRRHAVLLAAEGDSAIGFLNAGLKQARSAAERATPGAPTLDWCGVISLQGVVLNAAREVTTLATAGGGAVHVRSARLADNARLNALAGAWGLDFGRRYETEADLATLRYGTLLLCVDQDLDGTGKIAPLVLVWIHLFWPALIRAGRVGRLATPVVRARPAGAKKGVAAVDFYSEAEYRLWAEADPARAAAHHVKYYKGLAAHESDAVARMFTLDAFRAAVYTYTLDDSAAALFDVYFGADAALRRAAMATPVAPLPPAEAAECRRRRELPVGRVQLDIDVKAYKLNAVARQIPCAVDGLNPARRKSGAGADRRFAGEAASADVKTFQLGGYIADKMHYHHGDSSLNATITYMAQAFPGAREYPLLIGIGQFGDRHGGAAGSPRYTSVRPSPLLRAVFPAADWWHLPFVFEDGERAEPLWYAPVVPLAVLESGSNVSEGWCHDSFGRDLAAVLRVVEAYLDGDAALTAAAERLHAEGASPDALAEVARLAAAWPLPVSPRGAGGVVRPYRGAPHSFGAYTYHADRRTITITELPRGVATDAYLATLAPGVAPAAAPARSPAKPAARPSARAALADLVERVDPTRNTADRVDTDVVLRPGAIEAICRDYGAADIDPIEDAFQLRASMRPHLNYVGAAGAVLEFGSDESGYLAALLYWAPVRRDTYRRRLERDLAVAELRAAEVTAVERFVAEAAAGGRRATDYDDEAAAAADLRARGYAELDRGLIHKPGFATAAELRAAMSGPGASFDYLLDLRERDFTRDAVASRAARSVAARDAAAAIAAALAERPVAGASVWRREITHFVEVLEKGIATKFQYD